MSELQSESQYTRNSDYEYEEDYIEEQVIYRNKNETVLDYPPIRTPPRVKSFSPRSNDYKYTPSFHVRQAEKTLKTLKSIVKEPGWEKIQTHKSGVVIYSRPGTNQYDKTPVFMGEHVISGVSPQSVFAVIGMRKLWDEWYEEGTLVENLNDTTSSTYMVMQAFGYKSRDLSLVEKIECTPNGSIFFAATSIDNQKVPLMDGRIRAEVKLNGWILEPIPFSPPKTKITYIIQAQVNGWIPSLLVKKYMMKRPLVLGTIDNYLKKNGPPPMIISATPPPSRGISTRTSNVSSDDGSLDAKHSRRKKIPRGRRHSVIINNDSVVEGLERSSTPPIRNQQMLARDSPVPSLFKEVLTPSQAPPHPLSHPFSHVSSHASSHESIPRRKHRKAAHRHAELAQKAITITKTLINDYDEWDLYSDNQGVKIFMKDIPGKTTPQMLGETIISGGFTPEDILSVIVSMDMRKSWDDRFEEGKTVERLGEDDDILARVCMKGTFPISGRDFATISKIEKDPETNTIWLAGTSVSDPLIPESKKHVRAELHVSGWKLQPVVDEFGQSNSVEVIYVVDIDIKLESIPSSILKNISVQTPMCVARIGELMKKTGHPPYIKTSSGTVISEEIDTKTYQYDLTVGSVGDGGVTEIKISKIMFPFGFNIFVIPESSEVELSPDRNIVRVTLPIGTGIETLNIKITKNLSKNVRYTFNGENILIADWEEFEEEEPRQTTPIGIPVELEEKIVEPLSPPEISHDDDTSDREDILIAHSEEPLSPPEIPHDDDTSDGEDILIAHSEEPLSPPEMPAHPVHDDNSFEEDILVAHSKEAEELRPTTPVEFEKKIVEPLSPTETSAHPIHGSNETSSTNATLVARDGFDITLLNGINAEENEYADEKVLNEYDQLKHGLLGHVPRGVVTPSTFKPIEAQKATYEISEEKDSKVVKDFQKIDYSIPEPDPSTKKYVPAPLFTLDTTKYIPEPTFIKSSETHTSNTVTSRPPGTTHIPRRISSRMIPTHMINQAQFHESNSDENAKSTPQRRVSRRVSSRMIPEHMMNKTQFFESNSDENAKSTSQQRASRRISSRMISEHLMNQTQFYELNSNENSSKRFSFFTTGDGSNTRIGIMLGKKEISFSPQEASLMFFFMVLAYYTGKFSRCIEL